MHPFLRALRDRLAPTVLTAAGVTLLAAGLLHYGSPADASPRSSPRLPSIWSRTSDEEVDVRVGVGADDTRRSNPWIVALQFAAGGPPTRDRSIIFG